MQKIFICTSFSTKIDAAGVVLPDYKKFISTIIQATRTAGYHCFAAIEAEGWKITKKDPTEEFRKDLQAARQSDIMIALLEEDVSAGVQIEIGYMLAEIEKNPQKRLVLAYQRGTVLSWSNAAIGKLHGITTLEYTRPEEIIAHIGALANSTQ